MNDSTTLVVFDLGGVLVRICRSWAEGCAAAGVPVRGDESMGSDRVKLARRDCTEAYQTGRLTCDEFFEKLAATTGGLYTPAEVQRIHDAWLLGEYPGVCDLVGRIRAAGVPTGVLSNTNHSHWERMAEADYPALGLVDHPHASHLLGMSKPGAAIYKEFQQRTSRAIGNGTAAQLRIVFFDDLPENVEAARAAGWDAEIIDHAGDTAAQMGAHLRKRGVL